MPDLRCSPGETASGSAANSQSGKPRNQWRGIRLFAAWAAAVWLAAGGAGCQQVSPEAGIEIETGAADLSVWVPDGWRAPVRFDEVSLEVGVAWANRGSAMAEDYAIVLTIDGDVAYRWDKPVLAPGSERIEKIGLVDLSDPYLLIQGQHTLKLILDPDEMVPELDRENNSFTLVREFQLQHQLPDLRLSIPSGSQWEGPVVIGGSDLIFGGVDGSPERGYFLAFGVANHGAKRDQEWPQKYSVELNDYPIKRWYFLSESDQVQSLGGARIHAVPIWKLTLGGQPLTLGDQQFYITIDETNAVIEADEQNNFLTGQVRLRPSRARTDFDQTDAAAVTVHAVYAVPAGSLDEQWDINGTIEGIVADLQTWLKDRTEGRGILWDEADGSLDITFIRLEQTETELAELPNSWHPIAEELYNRGLNTPNKIFAVWYPSTRRDSETLLCGVQTEYRSVAFAFSFFKRIADGPNLCINQAATMVHELFHAFGAVAPCATNYFSGPGLLKTRHVDDDPSDLLYAGDRTGFPLNLDKDHDDYFGHDIPGCPDAADSPYLEPLD